MGSLLWGGGLDLLLELGVLAGHGFGDSFCSFAPAEKTPGATYSETYLHTKPCFPRLFIQTFKAPFPDDVAGFADHPDLSGWSAFICGYPAMVHEARKPALMAGVPIRQIHADPFDLKDLRTVLREGEMARPDGW